MHDALAWLQSSALGMFMRGSGPWTYPVVNLIHVLGVATLFGAVLILDLRLLGAWRRAPLAAITTVAAPVAMAGFALAAASGVCLLAANALEYQDNPVLLVKFSAIGLGIVNAVVLRCTAAWQAHTTRDLSHSETRRLGLMGGVSLVSWLTAVGAGRMIGYWQNAVDTHWIPMFPRARYLFGAADVDCWAHSEDGLHAPAFDDSVQPVIGAGLVDAVSATAA